jgi:Ras-related protein Ral-A
LVGNKADLESRRKVPYDHAQQVADHWEVPYIETSAKTRTNLDRVFYDLMREIYRRKMAEDRVTQNMRSKKAKKKKRCVVI